MADGLPLDALRAEIESWPIASAAAFRVALTKLDLGHDRVLGGKTKELWAGLERELRLRAGRARLDELTPIRDDAWFSLTDRAVMGVHAGPVALHAYLGRLARSALADDGAITALRAPSPDEEPTPAIDQIERWRWLSIYLPPELLLSALAASGDHDARGHVEIMPMALGRILQQKHVAQQHLHVGAGPSLARLWDALTTATEFAKRLDGELPLEHFEAVLLAAGFARRVLAEHVERIDGDAPTSFDESLAWFATHCAARRGRTPHDWRRDAERLLRMIEQPAAPVERIAWITRARRRLPPRRREFPHGELLRRCLAALASAPDVRLERVFLQYVRVYAITYRHLVQDPSSCGLDWFTRHFERISPMTARALKRERLTQTLRNDGLGLRLESLEIRTSPEPTWHDTGREVRDYAREVACWPAAPEEWGITFHLIKRHEMKVRDGRSQRTGDVGSGMRYGRWYSEAAQRIRAIEHLLRRRPEALAVIRGIDVANVELAVPTWIVAPLLVRLREASRQVALEAARRRGINGLGEIQVVPHVGEDYRRLSEGLRRMDEMLAGGVLSRGSRVGHGLALGEDPSCWCNDHPVVYQPLEELLFDLLWELTLVEDRRVISSPGRIAYVQAQVRRWGGALFADPGISVKQLLEGYRALLDPRGVGRFGYGKPSAAAREHRTCAERWLFDRGVFLRGLQPVSVEATTDEACVLGEAQLNVMTRFANTSITIECNPSSNLLVGGLASFLEHPVFRFYPPIAIDDAQRPRLSVSLNTDDPISFATRLTDEYAYAYHALARDGITDTVAVAWLDNIRDMGWRSRITRPESRDPAVIERLARWPRR